MARNFFKRTLEERRQDRCARCELRKTLCICPLIPEIRLSTRLVVLMHVAELKLTTNTARLAALALPGSEIRLRGKIGEPLTGDGLLQPGEDSLFLFPSEKARLLTREGASGLRRPVTLVVPDGSWRQARKVASSLPVLSEIPHVTLPEGPPSEYRLRVTSHEHKLSTFEAIARALGILEGPEVQERLEEIFRVKVGRTLWARGLMRAEDCPGGIPEAAIHEGQRPSVS